MILAACVLAVMLPANLQADLAALLPKLTPAERAQVDALMPIWGPNHGPQVSALFSQADELFYGGAAGGGKTDLLIGCALTQHQKSIVFRREYEQLKDAIERADGIAAGLGRVNQNSKILRVRRPGEPMRSLEFAGVQYEESKNKYRGRPHDLKGFDEITEFTYSQYRFLTGWLRSIVPGQRCRVIATGNPPTHTEGLWVLEYWGAWLDEKHPNPALPGELRWYAMVNGEEIEVSGPQPIQNGKELVYPSSRTFIPARLEDNPDLERTGYRRTLQRLPEPLRSQLLYGDFKAGSSDDAFQVIPTAWIRAAMERWKSAPRPNIAQTCLGVDVARGGKDRTATVSRRAWWFDQVLTFPGTTTKDGPAVAAIALPMLAEGGFAAVDAEGIGASAYDSIRMSKGRAAAVCFGDGAPDDASDHSGILSFANLRAYCYWMVREALDPDPTKNPEPVALPDDRELLGDLASPKYSVRNGRILVESKDEIKKRIGRSPDKGDAVALTFAPGPVLLTKHSVATGRPEFSWGDES